MFNRKSASILFLLVALIQGCVHTTTEQVTIIRDQWGVPHVFALTDEAAFFGAGYATAQDRLFQIHRTRLLMQGRLAELLGDKDPSIIEQDKNMRHLGYYRYAQERAKHLDQETRRALEAYSAGVNEYIATHKENLLYLFENTLPEPWTPADSLVVLDYGFASLPSDAEVALRHQFEDKVAELGSPEAALKTLTLPPMIMDDSAAVVQPHDLSPQTLHEMQAYAQTYPASTIYIPASTRKMSHTFVINGEKTTTGKPLLYSNAQLTPTFPNFWHEIHIKGATIDARGIAIPGVPGFMSGFNRQVAWGRSASAADLGDVYRLKMVTPDTYEYDNKVYTIKTWKETINVKNSQPHTIILKDTIFGPVITPLLQSARPGEEYIFRTIPLIDNNIHSVQTMIATMKATDISTFGEALKYWRVPPVHTIAADNQGNIGYWHTVAIPVRSPDVPLSGIMAQELSSSTLWPDILPFHLRPHVRNPQENVLYTANHLPIGSWYQVNLGSRPTEFGDTVRSWRLRELLLNNNIWSPEELLTVHHDTINPAVREIVRTALHLRDKQKNTFSQETQQALTLFEPWYQRGANSVTTEPALPLVLSMNLQFRATARDLIPLYGRGESGMVTFLKDVKQRLDNNPDAILTQDEQAFIDLALAQSWNTAIARYGSPEQWNSLPTLAAYTLQYFNTAFEHYGSLDPQYDLTYTGITNPDQGTIWSQTGQTYTHIVNLADIDSSLAILPIGNTEHPESPFASNQAELWLTGKLRPAPLSEERIMENAVSEEMVFYTPRSTFSSLFSTVKASTQKML